jgi:dienelactone hydrolase
MKRDTKSYFAYLEDLRAGDDFRSAYQNGLDAIIKKKQAESSQKRDKYFKDFPNNIEQYRLDFKKMLGWPLTEEPSPILDVREKLIFSEENCEATRMWFELFPGLHFYGILFKQKGNRGNNPLPLVFAVHGGSSTTELCIGLFGNTANYNNMVHRLLHQGVNVFTPQLLLWKEIFVPANLRNEYDYKLKQLGGSTTAFEIYCLSRCIDYFSAKNWVKNIGMIGLSYGGFFTLYTAAADIRILASYTSCSFNDRIKNESYKKDSFWFNSANTFLDAEAGALVYPRYLRIEAGIADPFYDSRSAEGEYKRLQRYYSGKPDALHFTIFNGAHEFYGYDNELDSFTSYLKT